MARLRNDNCCAIALVSLLASTAHASLISTGPDGINSSGLPLTGTGVVIGQVERFRPGDAEAGDNLAHRNTSIDPADVFEQNDPGDPPDSLAVMNHAEWVAGVMISADATDPNMDGDAPVGVALGASLFSSA